MITLLLTETTLAAWAREHSDAVLEWLEETVLTLLADRHAMERSTDSSIALHTARAAVKNYAVGRNVWIPGRVLAVLEEHDRVWALGELADLLMPRVAGPTPESQSCSPRAGLHTTT